MVVVGLLSAVLVARAYGVEAIGEYAIALAPAATLGTLSQLREQAALVRELAPLAPRVTGLFAAVMSFSFGLTVVVAVPVTIGSWLVLSGPIGRSDLFAPAAPLIAPFVL